MNTPIRTDRTRKLALQLKTLAIVLIALADVGVNSPVAVALAGSNNPPTP